MTSTYMREGAVALALIGWLYGVTVGKETPRKRRNHADICWSMSFTRVMISSGVILRLYMFGYYQCQFIFIQLDNEGKKTPMT